LVIYTEIFILSVWTPLAEPFGVTIRPLNCVRPVPHMLTAWGLPGFHSLSAYEWRVLFWNGQRLSFLKFSPSNLCTWNGIVTLHNKLNCTPFLTRLLVPHLFRYSTSRHLNKSNYSPLFRSVRYKTVWITDVFIQAGDLEGRVWPPSEWRRTARNCGIWYALKYHIDNEEINFPGSCQMKVISNNRSPIFFPQHLAWHFNSTWETNYQIHLAVFWCKFTAFSLSWIKWKSSDCPLSDTRHEHSYLISAKLHIGWIPFSLLLIDFFGGSYLGRKDQDS